jgi:DnaJ-class molecular chaperone
VSNDPDLLDQWVECDACQGEGTQLDDNDLDINCPECDGDGGWEQQR